MSYSFLGIKTVNPFSCFDKKYYLNRESLKLKGSKIILNDKQKVDIHSLYKEGIKRV